MRILFYNWEYPPIGAGIGQYIFLMSQALRNAGHFSVVVTSRHPHFPRKENVENGVIYRIFERNSMNSPAVVTELLRICKKYKIDIIEGAEHLGGCRLLLEIEKRPPVVIKMHYNDVLFPLRYAQACFSWQYAAIWLACQRQRIRIQNERYCIEHADFLTAPSRKIIDLAYKQSLKLPENPKVISNPIEITTDWNNKEDGAPLILFVGRIDFGKGVQFLPQIVQFVCTASPDTRFVIAGGSGHAWGIGEVEGWLRKKLGKWRQHVDFKGFVDRGQLDEMYRKAWVVIVPSVWDTFPNVVLEAMARKKAIVASSNGGIKEMLSGTDNIIANMDEFPGCVVRLLQERKLRAEAGESGYKKYRKKYCSSVIVDTYLQIMEERILKVSA